MPSARDIKAGRASVTIATRNKLAAGLALAKRQLQSFAATSTTVGRTVAIAGALILAPFIAGAKIFAKAGDELHKMSGRTGISVKRLSELDFAANRSGASLKTVETAARGMAKIVLNAERGLSTATDTLDDLGVSLDDIKGKNPDDLLTFFLEKVSDVEDPVRRAALAMQVFGKSGTQLLPLLSNGSAGIEDLAAEAHRLGVVLDEEDAEAGAKLTDALFNLGQVAKAVFLRIGDAVAGPLTSFANWLAAVGGGVVEFVRENKKLVTAIGIIGEGLLIGGGALLLFGGALSLAITGVSAIGAVLGAVLSPFGLVAAALIGGAGYFLFYTEAGRSVVDWFANNFGQLAGIVTKVTGGVFDAISAGDLGLAAEIAFAGVKLAAVVAMEAVLGIFGSSIEDMSKLLAELFKQLGTFVGQLNEARVSAVNFLSEHLGNLVGVDTSVEQEAATNAARGFTAGFEAIDTSKLGEGIAAALNPDALESQLDALLERAKNLKDETKDIDTSFDEITLDVPEETVAAFEGVKQSLAALGSLSAGSLNRSFSAGQNFEKQISENTRETVTLLGELLAARGSFFT